MANGRTVVNRLEAYLEPLFPHWMHQRYRYRWERRWLNPEFSPFWKTNQPQKELVDAIESGWFPKNRRVIDVGCGNGEISRWLAGQGFAVLGLDYSAAAIENCRRLSAGHPNAPTFEVLDLCGEHLRLEPAFSLIDRGCFHRIVGNLRPVFVQNIANAAIEGGHFLLVAGTPQHARVANCGTARSEQHLRDHVAKIFGNHFIIERAERALINGSERQETKPALAFWMVRKPTVAGCEWAARRGSSPALTAFTLDREIRAKVRSESSSNPAL